MARHRPARVTQLLLDFDLRSAQFLRHRRERMAQAVDIELSAQS